MTPEALLAKHGIHLESTAAGRYYTTCPRCSMDRTKPGHKNAKCLGVTVTNDTAHWGCNHCNWTGPEKGGGERQALQAYIYRDAAGTSLFRKARNLPGREPRFWLERSDGSGGWIKGLSKDTNSKVLYRLDEVNKAIGDGRIVACVEGEKDADNLWDLGIAATCNAHGAQDPTKKQQPKWYREHSEQLRGADIVVFNDNDSAGHEHAEATCKLSAGVARRVRRLDLAFHWPGIPKGGDVSDWLALGHTREELNALIEAAPDYVLATAQDKTGEATRERRVAHDAGADFHGAGNGAGPGNTAAYLSFGPFDMRDDGLFQQVKRGRGKDAKLVTERVSAPFEILGRARDPNGRAWGRFLRWRDPDGRSHERFVADESLHGDPSAVCGPLAADGLAIVRAQQRAFVSYLSSAHLPERVTVVEHTGWHSIDGADVFVLPNEVIGPKLAGRVVLAGTAHGPYETKGTLAEWREGVGALTDGQTIPILAISTAFAGPLLHPAGLEGGGLNLFGPSSRGKTTCQQAAASVWGRGATPGYVRAWRATANGLEGAAAQSTDTLMVLDELGMVDPREAAQALYALASGVGKQRAGRDGSLRETKSWRVLYLSSGELPVEAKLSEAPGRKARAGQLVRLLDVPGDCGAGFGVFDNVGPDGDAAALAKEIKLAAISAHGTAGPEFMRRLIADGVTGAEVHKLVQEFVVATIPADADGQVERAASRFGLIFAAGELATTFGIVPWPAGAARAAACWGLEQWIELRGGTESAETRQAIEAVRLFIERHGEARFASPDDADDDDDDDTRPVANRAGYRKGSGAEGEWWILPEVWKTEVCAGQDPKLVARVLAARGMLRKQEPRLQSVVRIGGRTLRAYVVTAKILAGAGDDED